MVNKVHHLLVSAVAAGCVVVACDSAGTQDDPSSFGVTGSGGDSGSLNQRDSEVLGSSDSEVSADTACKKMDIVFVVDNSLSMKEEQTNLASNFPKFVDVLNKFTSKNGEPIDYRIAVTTTGIDVNVTEVISGKNQPTEVQKGENGAFKTTTGMTRPWLERSDANISSTFTTIANVGLAGPSWEMPLEGSRRALGDRLQDTNKGFVRDDALLGIVYLTDEDDCSLTKANITLPEGSTCSAVSEPTGTYTSFFDKLKGVRGRWAAAVIAGQTKCKSTFGSAIEAKRLKTFVTEVGASAIFSSICEGDLSKGLEEALNTFNTACKSFPAH